MATDPRCRVEVGTHPGPFWRDLNSDLIVCNRHRSQFNERADELGPFLWSPQQTEPHAILVERFDAWLTLTPGEPTGADLARIATDFYQEVADGRVPLD